MAGLYNLGVQLTSYDLRVLNLLHKSLNRYRQAVMGMKVDVLKSW